MHRRALIFATALVCCLGSLSAQQRVETELTQVVSRPITATSTVVGELAPYQQVDIHAKITGFIDKIHVDRGSQVKAGDLLATMTAPEIEARRLAAEARIPEIEAERVEAEAKLAGLRSTYERISEAAKTPGVVAGNEVVLAQKGVEAAEARIAAYAKSVEAAKAGVRAVAALQDYLQIRAPFSGVITERMVHPGALAGPENQSKEPLFHLQQVTRLRLVAAVPESLYASVRRGRRVPFTVRAYPGETFTGSVARSASAVDPATRTLPVELDVANSSLRLAPGMYAEVDWPVRRTGESLFVPRTAIKQTTERIFVIRVEQGKAEWVDVRRGVAEQDMVEVLGDLKAGDTVVLRATDEIRPGTAVAARAPSKP